MESLDITLTLGIGAATGYVAGFATLAAAWWLQKNEAQKETAVVEETPDPPPDEQTELSHHQISFRF